MLTFSAVTDNPHNLPGLFDYLTATWGDGIPLPTSAGLLAYSYLNMTPQAHEHPLIVAAATIGGCAGVFTQLQWLADDHPVLNWTLPRPHQFNAAGTYHAAFLVAACAAFASGWAGVLLRLSKTRNQPNAAKRAAIGALLAEVCFAGLVLADNRTPGRTSQSATATTIGLAAGAIGLAAGASAARRIRAKSDA